MLQGRKRVRSGPLLQRYVRVHRRRTRIPEEKLILHEDSWGGGGNLGACMEFFVDGLELWNQVYMFYKQTPEGYEELDLKVLDMGMGQERISWISHGSETS